MKALRTTFLFVAIAAASLATLACKSEDPKEKVSPPEVTFYHWKSVYQPGELEKKILKDLNSQRLYVRMFDVSYAMDEAPIALVPVATAAFRENPELPVVPVVYIDNASLLKYEKDIPSEELAEKIVKRVSAMMKANKLQDAGELQIDCDWTAGSREYFFNLLTQIKSLLPAEHVLSITLRLHQYKNPDETGVPPADKVTLMVYNTGSLRAFGKANSIIEPQVVSSYLKTEKAYPLPINVALPLFSWSVLFDKSMQYKGLMRTIPDNLTDKNIWKKVDRSLYQLAEDQVIDGRKLPAGWYLRAETVSKNVLTDVAGLLAQSLPEVDAVIFYHLDEQTLKEWSEDELNKIAHLLN